MPSALVANPRRRRRRRHTAVVNPRRRRSHGRRKNPRRRRRAHNPGGGGGFVGAAKSTLRQAVGPSISALAGGAVAGLASTKFGGGSPIITALLKAGIGIGGAAFLRRKPSNAWAFYGASVGSIGSDIGVRIGGGLVAHTKGSVMKGLADMASEDGEMAALLAGAGVEDIGDLIDMGDIADDDDAMGDLVEEVAGLADEEEEAA